MEICKRNVTSSIAMHRLESFFFRFCFGCMFCEKGFCPEPMSEFVHAYENPVMSHSFFHRCTLEKSVLLIQHAPISQKNETWYVKLKVNECIAHHKSGYMCIACIGIEIVDLMRRGCKRSIEPHADNVDALKAKPAGDLWIWLLWIRKYLSTIAATITVCRKKMKNKK